MPSFLEDVTPFIGTGKRNEDTELCKIWIQVWQQDQYAAWRSGCVCCADG